MAHLTYLAYLATTCQEPFDTLSTMAALGEELLSVVNKLQDLVFNTIGNDSLDLPQIVRPRTRIQS